MKKTLTILSTTFLTLSVINAHARYIPYVEKSAQKSSVDEYDQNKDSYITADEVEVELREDAINKVIKMQKQGLSKADTDKVIMQMEDSIEEDAEAIIDVLDKDGDELVEPEEIK